MLQFQKDKMGGGGGEWNVAIIIEIIQEFPRNEGKWVWPREPANCPKLIKTHTFTKTFHDIISEENLLKQKEWLHTKVLSEMAD